jgi:hypothetical protein
MTHEKTMAYLGYVVRLEDGSVNPVAAEADRILCERPRVDNIMTGVAVAEAWAEARATLEGKPRGRVISIANLYKNQKDA